MVVANNQKQMRQPGIKHKLRFPVSCRGVCDVHGCSSVAPVALGARHRLGGSATDCTRDPDSSEERKSSSHYSYGGIGLGIGIGVGYIGIGIILQNGITIDNGGSGFQIPVSSQTYERLASATASCGSPP